MKKLNLSIIIVILFFLYSCQSTDNKLTDVSYTPINGFSEKANQQLEAFFKKHKETKGRKIAVFDGDGTVLGQTPHYLADECMYQYAKENPDWNKNVIDTIVKHSNVSLPYVQMRVKYISGKSLQFYRDLGEKIFKAHYKNKIFSPMKNLIELLKKNNFEVWIVTASPEGMYQQFLSNEFNIPITNIVGVKSVIKNGIVTDKMVHPIPQDHGKKEAIETFIQDRPLLVAGNSRGDKEMIEFSSDLKIIVNPDEHVAHDQKISISDYAKKQNWIVIRINDIPEKGFPSTSSKKFNIRLNKSREVKSVK